MSQVIPPNNGRADWPRLVANAVNKLTNYMNAKTVTFAPTSEPADPVEGQTYMDSITHKLRTYDGTAWQDHW